MHDKVNEAFASIRDQEAEANNLEPKLDKSSTLVAELRSQVEEWRQKYIQVRRLGSRLSSQIFSSGPDLVVCTL